MKLVKFNILSDKTGDKIEISINPMQILMIVPIPIPGEIKGLDGNPISREGAGIDLGMKMLLADHTVEEAMKIWEDGLRN